MDGDNTRPITRLMGMLAISCVIAPCSPIIFALGYIFVPLVHFTYGPEKIWWLVLGLVWNAFIVGVISMGVIVVIKSVREVRAIWVKNNKQLIVLCVGVVMIVSEIIYEIGLSFASRYDWPFLRAINHIRILLVTFPTFLLAGCLIYGFRDRKLEGEPNNDAAC